MQCPKLLSGHGLTWQAALKNAKVKLDLVTRFQHVINGRKSIRGRICHSIY